MKKTKYFGLLLFLVLCSCNNDFVNEQPDFQYVSNKIIFLYAKNYTHNVQFLGLADKKFTIDKKPDWLNLDFSNGKFNSDGIFDFQCSVDKHFFPSGTKVFQDIIVLDIENFGKLGIAIYYVQNVGDPRLYSVYPDKIYFGHSETKSNLTMNNQGEGSFLIWEIISCPQWLKCEKLNGIIPQYESAYINFECDRNLMPSNFVSDTIIISTNDYRRPTVRIPVEAIRGSNPANIKEIDGKVINAFFDKSTNLLYIATSQPNKIIVYDITSRNIVNTKTFDIPLSRMAFSEDKSKIALGSGGNMISCLNTADLSEIKTLTMRRTVCDIEFINENTICYTVTKDNDSLYYVDIQSRTVNRFAQTNNLFDSRTRIKKIPNKNYIVAYRTYTLPSGFYLFDTETKNLIKYLHEDLTTFNFSSDGNYMFDWTGRVFLTNNLPTCTRFDNIVYANVKKYVQSIDSGENSIYCGIVNSYGNENSPNITKYNSNNFSVVDYFFYDEYYKNYSELRPYFLFVNSDETMIVVIKIDYHYYSDNAPWLLEFIPIN